MQGYRKRFVLSDIIKRLQVNPAVTLLGARQVDIDTGRK